MTNKIPKIHQYDLGFYPRKIWVVKTKDPLIIKEHFYDYNGDDLSDNHGVANLTAFVMRVALKDSMDMGYVVCLCGRADVGTCAHEAFHVVDMLSDDIGLDVTSNATNEHIAYLIGYVTEIVWNVNTNKSERLLLKTEKPTSKVAKKKK